MKSAPRGDITSQVEVSGISPHGIWLFLGDREAFLPFAEFPWFRDASVAGVLHVERPQPHHLYWPDLDVDLDVQSILHPEQFPLISREKPRARPQRAIAPRGVARRPAPKQPRRTKR